MTRVVPYSTLALCYDTVMDYVDYDEWIVYVETLLDRYDHDPGAVLELGCGTGTFARLFAGRHNVSYLATDASPEMLCVARAKCEGTNVEFSPVGFGELLFDQRFDTVLLLYDGLNYLLKESDVEDLFRRVYRALRPGGLFVFDQSTPANSLNNQAFFEDKGALGSLSYTRSSSYEEDTAIHTTTFEILSNDMLFEEIHHQKCYTGPQIQAILERSQMEIEGGYSGFSLETADTESERIHWVVRKP